MNSKELCNLALRGNNLTGTAAGATVLFPTITLKEYTMQRQYHEWPMKKGYDSVARFKIYLQLIGIAALWHEVFNI